jgi:hypothetical protein
VVLRREPPRPASTMDEADNVCSSSPVLRMEVSSNSHNCVSKHLSRSDLWAGARSPLWRRRGPGSGSASGGPGGAVEGALVRGAGPAGSEGDRWQVMRGSLASTGAGTRTGVVTLLWT